MIKWLLGTPNSVDSLIETAIQNGDTVEIKPCVVLNTGVYPHRSVRADSKEGIFIELRSSGFWNSLFIDVNSDGADDNSGFTTETKIDQITQKLDRQNVDYEIVDEEAYLNTFEYIIFK